MSSKFKNIPVLNRLEGSNAQETQIRLSLSLEHAFPYEKDTVLGEVYRFWMAASDPAHKLPFADLLGKREKLTAEAQASISSVIDVTSEDPLNFLIKEQTLKTRFRNNKGLRLIELSSHLVRDALLLEYAQAKCGAPQAITEVHQWRHATNREANNITRHYVKIDLPVTDRKTGKVNYLLVVSRLLQQNIIGLPRLLKNSELVG